MEYSDNAYNSLRRYFDVLSQTGSYPYKDVTGLLLYCFIVDQVFEGQLSMYLDDEGLAAFNKAIRCIASNGCLVDSSANTIRITDVRPWSPSQIFRYTESENQRLTEDNNMRKMEDNIYPLEDN